MEWKSISADSQYNTRINQAQQAQQKLAIKASQGIFRQRYHFMSPGGWLNDPNGCIWYQGQYHLYYQHNPFDSVWGEMYWGHAISKDLVHWRHLPIALAPSEAYDDHPLGGVFSGSTIEKDDALIAAYTATTFQGNHYIQTQCLARSTDGGLSFEKYANNPVIVSPPAGVSADIRDPRIIQHGNRWYIVLGASLGAGAWKHGEGCALLYESTDMVNWIYRGIIARSNGKLGTMWECVDLYPLNGQWVLSFSPMFLGNSKTVCLTGTMDFQSACFSWHTRSELDWGAEYYAAQSLTDGRGRTILMAWQNAWDWMPWWRDFGPVSGEGWCGCMALPRSVSLDQKNRIMSMPVKELMSLRSNERRTGWLTLDEHPKEIPCADPVAFEMEVKINLQRTQSGAVYIDLRSNGDKRSRLIIDLENLRLTFDRNHADNGYVKGICTCDLPVDGNLLDCRIYSDTISIEVFAAGGLCCMSNLIYPTHQDQHCQIYTEDGPAQVKITTWQIA